MRRAELSRGKGPARASHGAGAAAKVPNARKEWRFQDGGCRVYSSQTPRPCNLAASQNHTLTVPFSQGHELLRALCLASEAIKMTPSSG